MPTYEYACSNCNKRWEELQKISEPALDTCPACGQKTAQRLISGGNFILKGGGWYADLYASSGSNKGGASGSSSSPSTASSASTGGTSESSSSSPSSSAPSASSGGDSKS